MQNLKEWADWIIETIKRVNERPSDNVKMCSVMEDEIHLYKGIHELAETLGAEVKKQRRQGEYNIKYYFTYKDTVFCQLGSEEDELCAK